MPDDRAGVLRLEKDMRAAATDDFQRVALHDQGGGLFDRQADHFLAGPFAASQLIELGRVTQQSREALEASTASVKVLFHNGPA